MFIDHRYEVLESLGSGFWANVYKVRDVRTDNLYTLKLYQYLSSEEFYKHFKPGDMHHITKIEHPNLSHVVDFGHVGDHIYSISDYFDGKSLSNFKFAANKVGVLYEIIVQICYALNALHTQNILHKDVKPENILCKISSKNIEVKLIDYGFSMLDLHKEEQTVSGTIPYIAPEVLQGKAVGYASDFYSLGVLIYRLLTNIYPFSLDQINALRSGSQQFFIPIFPSELNPAVPAHLDNLCLTLLSRSPENRYNNSGEIINYINRAIDKEYPFSVSWSLVNAMRFNSYTVRDSLVDDLLAYMPLVEAGNGRVVSLLGGEGLGKDNILSLFRYNILKGSYFIFDYTCTHQEHEAFFALIKEYLRSLSPDEIKSNFSQPVMSEKMHQYLFTSEEAAKDVTQSQEELKTDFNFAKQLMVELAKNKPVIFIIRNLQYVHHYTIDFINHISQAVASNRILILLSSTEYNKVRNIEHTVLKHIPVFEKHETSAYIGKLINADIPEDFSTAMHRRASGNPYFTREILIDLTLRKQISFDKELQFPDNLDDYTLPSRLLHSIYSRMSHLTDINYKLLQKLAIIHTPITQDIIKYICKVNDNELYLLLNDGKYNEVLDKREGYYYFSYPEAKERFSSECQPRLQELVSLRILKYFVEKKKALDKETCKGLIKNARIAGMKESERLYLLKLYYLHCADFEFEQACQVIAETVGIDFNQQISVPPEQMASDLFEYRKMVETTGFNINSNDLTGIQKNLPELFEKYLLLGISSLINEEFQSSLQYFRKAAKMTTSPEQKAAVLLYQAEVSSYIDLAVMRKTLDQFVPDNLPNILILHFAELEASYMLKTGKPEHAIEVLESFLHRCPPSQDPFTMFRIALIHNLLGEISSFQKNIDEAGEHFNTTLSIWKRYDFQRYLPRIYNNLSDLYLKQGLTVLAARQSALGLRCALEQGNLKAEARALLNQGEAFIKMGEFGEAEKKLLEAQTKLDSAGIHSHKETIVSNLALAKSKINGFGHYYKFIAEHEPKLLDGHVPEINPLVKTYFYYLSEMSNARKLRNLIRKNTHLDFQQANELEFYHNILSMAAIAEKDYTTALNELRLATRYAGEVKNHYAMTVFSVLQINCFYGLKDYAKARDLISAALPGAIENQYRYWEKSMDLMSLKINLTDPSIPLRKMLRNAKTLCDECTNFGYYQLVIEIMQIRIQLLVEMKADNKVKEAFNDYQEYLDEVTTEISSDDRQSFLKQNLYYTKSLDQFVKFPVASRRSDTRKKWNDLLFNIANVNSVQRIKFLIEKGINQVLAPWQFKLMVYSDKLSGYNEFVSFNSMAEQAVSSDYAPLIESAFESDSLIQIRDRDCNVVIIPMSSGSKKIGFLIINDAGELEFTPAEIAIMRNIRQHLSALIIRTWDYMGITVKLEKMNMLMNAAQSLIRTMKMSELESEIVSLAIDLMNAARGYMIKKDDEGNNLYQVQMDQKKQLLSNVSGISKTALAICQNDPMPLITFNAALDKRFENSVSVQDYAIQSIFCSQLTVDNRVFGYLYLDNLGDSTREMYMNEDILALYLNQVSIALKNSLQYSGFMEKSVELNSLEQLKDEFIAIVSHELNTPLTSVQSYVSRLKRNVYADEEERQAIISKLESSVARLSTSISDISTMNSYNISKTLTKAHMNIAEVINLIYNEIQILSRQRKMQLKLEIEKDLPEITGNWTAIHRMIYNIVLNAVRFTREFGSIVIGVRRSAFPLEKIDNKETIVVFVKDNGMGIPQHRINDVYRKFFELNEIYAHKSGTVEYRSSGLGLGLAMSRRIAELHGGQINIKSKQGEGTTVFMILPLK
jgi:signal transduction histidine kinase/tetratricopeptide (TPR) repeat protein